jgi:hypothetical protein
VADQHHVVQVLEAQQVDHVGDVDLEIGVGPGQVGALTQPGQAQRVHVVAMCAQRGGDRAPGPCSEPEPGHQYECRHATHATINTGQVPPG